MFTSPVRTMLAFSLLAAIGLGLVGCLKFPLGNPETAKVDPQLAGAWLSTSKDGDEGQLWVVKQWDNRTYIATQYRYKQTASGIENGGRTTMKAWLAEAGGSQFVTLQFIDNSESTDKPYAVAKYVREGDTLTISGIDPKFIDSAQCDTADAFAKLVADNVSDPKLYLDAQTYEKLGATREGDVKAILEAFENK